MTKSENPHHIITEYDENTGEFLAAFSDDLEKYGGFEGILAAIESSPAGKLSNVPLGSHHNQGQAVRNLLIQKKRLPPSM